jgi:hypothetical protein
MVKVKRGKVITIQPFADAPSIEESLTLLGCMFRGLELILLFKQSAVLLFNKSSLPMML